MGRFPQGEIPGGGDYQTYKCGCTANGPGKLPNYCPVHGPAAAAPPPPEDALLAETKRVLAWLQQEEANVWCDPDDPAKLDILREPYRDARDLIKQLSDRIAADAKLITRMTDIMNTGAATIAAAEARAKGLEADQHAMRAALQSIASGFDDPAMPQKIARATLAAIAPDSRKERG